MKVFIDKINEKLIFKLENVSGYFLGSPSTGSGNCCFYCESATYRHKLSDDTDHDVCYSCRIYVCDAEKKSYTIYVNLLKRSHVSNSPVLEISSWRHSIPEYYIQSPDFEFHFSDKGLWDAIKNVRLHLSTQGFLKTAKNLPRILDHYGELGCFQLNQGASLSNTHLFIIAYSFLVLSPFDYPS